MKLRTICENNDLFDTVTNFLLNPKYRDTTWHELMVLFRKSGGSIIGSGKNSMVLEHPNWPYVLKLYPSDNFYTRFVRFAYKIRHKSFPKFYGPPKAVVPFYKRHKSEAVLYVVLMEELKEIPSSLFKTINDWYKIGISYVHAVKMGMANNGNYEDIKTIIKQNPELYSLFEGLYLITVNKLDGAIDMHRDNVMQRDNGELVMVDPLWEGSSPYSDYDRMLKIETDYYGDMAEPDVIGGKLPRKKREKRKKEKNTYSPNDDVPF
jgi:hypothetical protein